MLLMSRLFLGTHHNWMVNFISNFMAFLSSSSSSSFMKLTQKFLPGMLPVHRLLEVKFPSKNIVTFRTYYQHQKTPMMVEPQTPHQIVTFTAFHTTVFKIISALTMQVFCVNFKQSTWLEFFATINALTSSSHVSCVYVSSSEVSKNFHYYIDCNLTSSLPYFH